MIIGLDLDNTIICYDEAIKRLALDIDSLPDDVPKTKLGVRDFLRAQDREPEWTEFQGKLYGPGMVYAEPFPSALETIAAFQEAGHSTIVISHRTRYPYLGPKHDLHESARAWISTHLSVGGMPLIKPSDVHLNEKKEDKIALVGALDCDLFVDDLIDVLTDDAFPSNTDGYWFSPNHDGKSAAIPDGIRVIKHWTDLAWLSKQ